jgi:hypothetical protein
MRQDADTMAPLALSRIRHAPLVASMAHSLPQLASSRHFTVYGLPDELVVVHDFAPTEIDNNIGSHVAGELLPLLAGTLPPQPEGYTLTAQDLFERCVGAIVRSIDASERRAWHLFYDNTLAALRDGEARCADNGAEDFIGTFRAIYRQVAELLAGVPHASVLDAASCFGFLPLFLSSVATGGRRMRIIGCDVNPALVALAEDYRRQRDAAGVAFVQADVLADDLPRVLARQGHAFEVITAIHLLEHLTPEEAMRAVDALWALAGRRLIIAVPFELEPDARFGHQQVFDEAKLIALGARTNGHARTFAYHGGWLVVDRVGSDTADIREPQA